MFPALSYMCTSEGAMFVCNWNQFKTYTPCPTLFVESPACTKLCRSWIAPLTTLLESNKANHTIHWYPLEIWITNIKLNQPHVFHHQFYCANSWRVCGLVCGLTFLPTHQNMFNFWAYLCPLHITCIARIYIQPYVLHRSCLILVHHPLVLLPVLTIYMHAYVSHPTRCFPSHDGPLRVSTWSLGIGYCDPHRVFMF